MLKDFLKTLTRCVDGSFISLVKLLFMHNSEIEHLIPQSLKTVLVDNALKNDRKLNSNIRLIDTSEFKETQEKIREVALNHQAVVGTFAHVDHSTGKLEVSPIQIADDDGLRPPASIKATVDENDRIVDQDKSLALVIMSAPVEQSVIPIVAGILLDQINAPHSVINVTPLGSDLFMRGDSTVSHNFEENVDLINRTVGMPLKDFAKQTKLLCFHAPIGASIAIHVN